MDDIFDFLLRKVLPLVFLLSFFGLGKGGKKKPAKQRPEVAPGSGRPPARRPEPAPGYDPFEELRPALEPIREVPRPVVVAPPPPRPRVRVPEPPPRTRGTARATSDPSLRSDREARSAYDIDAGSAYALDATETAQRGNQTDQGAYVIGARSEVRLAGARDLVKRRALDREAVRRAILMKEVLGLPVALRDEERRYF